MTISLIRSSIPEGENWPTAVRLCDDDDNAFASGGISAVVVTVYDLSGATPTTNLVTSGTRIPSLVFFDTLQTDHGWITDDIGFNFYDSISPSMLTGGAAVKGGHVALIEYKVTTFQYGVRQIRHLVTVTAQANT